MLTRKDERGEIIARRWKGWKRCGCLSARRRPIRCRGWSSSAICSTDPIAGARWRPTGRRRRPPISSAAWDAALGHTRLAELLSDPAAAARPPPASHSVRDGVSPSGRPGAAISSGLSQLDKYLNRAWYRAGIPAQLHDDSSQAVYATLLQNLGTSAVRRPGRRSRGTGGSAMSSAARRPTAWPSSAPWTW